MLKSLKTKQILHLAMAWGLIPLAYLSWCFSTIAYKNESFVLISGSLGIVVALVYIFEKSIITTDIQKKEEIIGLDIGIVIFGILFTLVIRDEYPYSDRLAIYVAVMLWIIIGVKGIYDQLQNANVLNRIAKWLKGHISLLILMFIVLILSLDSNMYQFKWDGLLYYKAVKEATLSSISSVALYGHIAMSSGGIYRLFASLTGDVCIGMLIANIVILELAVCSFYGIVKCVIPDKKDWEYALATACFAFSPFLLGMSDYFSTDWFSVCTSVTLLYFVLNGKWIWTIIMGCIFCMTKEPALIAYTGLCLGLLVVDLFEVKHIKNWFQRIIKCAHYYFMLIPYILWFLTYKILGQWNAGNGGFAFDPAYMVEKLKVFFLFNFNWIITLILIICVIIACNKGKLKENLSWFIPLICSNICLLIFNLAFSTVNHARYIDSFISVNILLAILLLMKVINNSKIRLAVMAGWSVVSLCSCYLSFDPVTKGLFDSKKVGTQILFSTDNLYYGDSSIYNKQLLWMEKPLAQAISDSMKENTAIVLAIADRSIYSFDGISDYSSMSKDIYKDTQYWDEDKQCRVPSVSEHVDKAKEFTLYQVSDGTCVDSIDCENQAISVIYIKGINDYRMSDDYEVVGSNDYVYRGWSISRDLLKKKN